MIVMVVIITCYLFRRDVMIVMVVIITCYLFKGGCDGCDYHLLPVQRGM